jgi:glucokinase
MERLYVIGVDVGGTNSDFAVVDARGTILHRGTIKTTGYSVAGDYVNALCGAIDKLIKDTGFEDKILAVGIGVPNGNYYNGIIEFAANIPWATKGPVPLAQMITDKINLPCTLTNDANAAAIGEMTYGAARGMKDFILITLGTGVGSGIVSNGQLIAGHNGFAGELGHVCIQRYNGRPCGCGRTGCLETYTSATGVAHSAREILELKNDQYSLLKEINDRPITSKDVFDAAQKGDKIAMEIFNFTGRKLGEAFANFIAFLSPEAIILFGGLVSSGDYLLKPVREAMNANILSIYTGKTKLILSELNGADAAILGASALGWEKGRINFL